MKKKREFQDADAHWVSRVNALARQMDNICASIHQTAWVEQTKSMRAEYLRIARRAK